jgi:hypothetical protein
MTEPEIPAPAGVLSSLPTSRPQRRSPKRDQAAPARASRAQARPAAPRTRPPRATRPARPTVAEAPKLTSPIAAQGYAAASGAVEPPSRTALVGSVLGGAGELAGIGVAAGRHVLRSLYGRLPHR